MPKPTALSSYPPIFFELIERFAQGETEFPLVDFSKATLMSLRFSFYAFRKALKREPGEAAKQLCPNIDAISGRITGPDAQGRFVLTFFLVDYDKLYEPLRQALAARAAPATPAIEQERVPLPLGNTPAHEDAVEKWLTQSKVTAASIASPPTNASEVRGARPTHCRAPADAVCMHPHCNCA